MKRFGIALFVIFACVAICAGATAQTAVPPENKFGATTAIDLSRGLKKPPILTVGTYALGVQHDVLKGFLGFKGTDVNLLLLGGVNAGESNALTGGLGAMFRPFPISREIRLDFGGFGRVQAGERGRFGLIIGISGSLGSPPSSSSSSSASVHEFTIR